MVSGILLAALTMPSADACKVTQADQIRLSAPGIYLEHLIEPSGGACAGGAPLSYAQPVFYLSGNSAGITLTRAQIASAVRRHMPNLDVTCGSEGSCLETVSFAYDRPAAGVICARLAGPKADGDTIWEHDVIAARCEAGEEVARLRFEASSGELIAAASLAEGAYLGRAKPRSRPAGGKGDAVLVTSRAGPVRVDQSATLLQPAMPGERAFVRTASGAVLTVSVPDSAEGHP